MPTGCSGCTVLNKMLNQRIQEVKDSQQQTLQKWIYTNEEVQKQLVALRGAVEQDRAAQIQDTNGPAHSIQEELSSHNRITAALEKRISRLEHEVQRRHPPPPPSSSTPPPPPPPHPPPFLAHWVHFSGRWRPFQVCSGTILRTNQTASLL